MNRQEKYSILVAVVLLVVLLIPIGLYFALRSSPNKVQIESWSTTVVGHKFTIIPLTVGGLTITFLVIGILILIIICIWYWKCRKSKLLIKKIKPSEAQISLPVHMSKVINKVYDNLLVKSRFPSKVDKNDKLVEHQTLKRNGEEEECEVTLDFHTKHDNEITKKLAPQFEMNLNEQQEIDFSFGKLVSDKPKVRSVAKLKKKPKIERKSKEFLKKSKEEIRKKFKAKPYTKPEVCQPVINEEYDTEADTTEQYQSYEEQKLVKKKKKKEKPKPKRKPKPKPAPKRRTKRSLMEHLEDYETDNENEDNEIPFKSSVLKKTTENLKRIPKRKVKPELLEKFMCSNIQEINEQQQPCENNRDKAQSKRRLKYPRGKPIKQIPDEEEEIEME